MANNAETTLNRPVLLLTRPAASSARFASRLDVSVASLADLVVSPLIEIRPLPAEIDLDGVDAVIFTSSNGVLNAPLGEGRKAHCVGSETAKTARSRGWQVATTALHADDLIERLAQAETSDMLHLYGVTHRGDVAERLTAKGHRTTRKEVYAQAPVPLTAEAQEVLKGERPVVVPLFSPNTASYFSQQANGLRRVYGIALSAAVGEALEGVPFTHLQVLDQPVGELMVRAVELHLSQKSLP